MTRHQRPKRFLRKAKAEAAAAASKPNLPQKQKSILNVFNGRLRRTR